MVARQKVNGTAAIQGELWGERARDWADIAEAATGRQLFEAGLQALNVDPGTVFLDIGCGTGLAAQMASQRGAKVSGLDASAASVAIARERTPQGDFRVGEMEDLPFADDSFNVVTGFNSFQYAANPVNALKEARRVATPGARILLAVWGRPERCEAAPFLKALGSLMPPPPPGTPGPFALSEDGALEALALQAGLTPVAAHHVDSTWVFADLETALRGLLSGGPVVKVMRHVGEQRARAATIDAISPYRMADGSYQLENQYRYLITTA